MFEFVSLVKIRSQVDGVASRTLRENRHSERHKAILTGTLESWDGDVYDMYWGKYTARLAEAANKVTSIL